MASTEDISTADIEHDKNEMAELMLMEYPKSDENDPEGLLDDHKGGNLKRKTTPINPMGMG